MHSTPVTQELSNLLINDFIKISGPYLPFEYLDLLAMDKSTVLHGYRQTFSIGNMNDNFYDAGHIPGSCIISVEAGSKRLLYTGDINGAETELLNPSWKDLGEADMVITESTYATADHPHRAEVEKAFVESCQRGGREGRGIARTCFLRRQGSGARHDATQERLQAPGRDGRYGTQGQRGPDAAPGISEGPRALPADAGEHRAYLRLVAEAQVHPEAGRDNRSRRDAGRGSFGLLQRAAVAEGEELDRSC